MSGVDVLWLVPDKPENLSVGRQRLTSHLRAAGHTITLRGTNPRTVLRSLRDGGEFDVILGTTRAGAIAGLVVARAHGVPFVVDHIDPIRQLRETDGWAVAAMVERLENVAFRLASHVLYVYPEETSRIERRATSWTQTDLGVDHERFADPSTAVVASAQDRLGDISSKVAIYIGGLERMYCIREMLESVGHLDGWTLVIAGTGSLQPEVEAAATNYDSVVYLGTVPHEEIPGYLQLAAVGIALVDDPQTLKVLEYGAAGLPVVQLVGRAESRFGGLVEYTSSTPGEIAAAIERAVVSRSGSELKTYVRAFDWAEIAATYDEVLRSVS